MTPSSLFPSQFLEWSCHGSVSKLMKLCFSIKKRSAPSLLALTQAMSVLITQKRQSAIVVLNENAPDTHIGSYISYI